MLGGLQVMLVQLAVVFTAFGTARWGQPAVLAVSALSMPAAAAIAAVYIHSTNGDFGRFNSLVDLVGYQQAVRVGDYSTVALIGLSGIAAARDPVAGRAW